MGCWALLNFSNLGNNLDTTVFLLCLTLKRIQCDLIETDLLRASSSHVA